MQLARESGRVADLPTVREAIALLTVPKDPAEAISRPLDAWERLAALRANPPRREDFTPEQVYGRVDAETAERLTPTMVESINNLNHLEARIDHARRVQRGAAEGLLELADEDWTDPEDEDPEVAENVVSGLRRFARALSLFVSAEEYDETTDRGWDRVGELWDEVGEARVECEAAIAAVRPSEEES